MINENLNFEGIDLICCPLEDLTQLDIELKELDLFVTVSSPLL